MDFTFIPRLALPIAIACAVASVSPGGEPKITPAQREFFEKNVRPLLAERCFGCHGRKNQESGFRLDSRRHALAGGDNGVAIVPGEPKQSPLVAAIKREGDLQMPPKGKLTDDEIASIVRWIEMGAPWPDGTGQPGNVDEVQALWSLKPPADSLPPDVKNSSWPRGAMDRFVLANLETAGLSPAPPADRRALIRRATFDLTGLPPTPEEVAAFVDDDSPRAFARVVDRLLASPAYGERWGRHWLDVVRYADTAGETADFPAPHAWRYRNYVIDAFNQDKPYDEFIREQLAGDLVAQSAPSISRERYAELMTATGYLAIARRFGYDPRKDHYLTIEDTIDTLGKSFLGLTIACARCHDHKYDPITTEDYYGLYGIFQSTRYAFPGSEKDKRPADLVPLLPSAKQDALVADHQAKVVALNREIVQQQAALTEASQTLVALASRPGVLLSEGVIDKGGEQVRELERIKVVRGQMIRLSIDPRGDYGADTTVIEWQLTEHDGKKRVWNITDDVVNDFLAANPHADRHGHTDTWCFFDGRKPGVLLNHRETYQEQAGLQIWHAGDLPSASVNTTDKPINVWTSLPPRTLFVHPAADGPVAVGWISPLDGVVSLRVRVADGHPEHGNGVGWRLEQYDGDFATAMAQPAQVSMKLAGLRSELQQLQANPPIAEFAYAVTEGQPADARLQRRGDPQDLAATVPRKNIDCLGGQHVEGETSGRLQLADWIASADNPLTARVMVNRIWQHHFGRGLVGTPNDFGQQGERPSHPELLDWLTQRFLESGWSIKSMHRRIMLSATYQLEAAYDIQRNQQYAAFAPRRLNAEEIRDALLWVGDTLDRSPGGPHPFPPADTWQFTQHNPFRADFDHNHRSVYLMRQRIQPRPLMALFDGADTNSSTAKRLTSTVPTQALYFLNSELVHRQATAFAARLQQANTDDVKRIELAHRIALAREATADEVQEALDFLDGYAAQSDRSKAWAAWCRVLLSSNEFVYVD